MQDSEIISGLVTNNEQRIYFETALYIQYKYYIEEGIRRHKLTYDDSFSAYSDTILSVIQNIRNNSFHQSSSLKTYLYQVFSNKCVDIIRRKTSNKQQANQFFGEPGLLSLLPDSAKTVIEKLIDQQKISAIKQQLETIGEKCREILLLFEDGYTDKEIAVRLSYHTASVAKTSRLRCLEKIKEKMKNAPYSNE